MSDDKKVMVEQVRGLANEVSNRGTADILNEKRRLGPELTDAEASRRMFLRSLISFTTAGAAATAGVLGWRWMPDDAKAGLLRRSFEFGEGVSQAFFSPSKLSKEFPISSVTPIRTNGLAGLESEIDLENWTLAVSGLPDRSDDLILTLDHIKRLPRADLVTEFKCIEGWSTITHFGGVRFSDFAAAYYPGFDLSKLSQLPTYVSLVTPDQQYFVGWDVPSIMHPQTLLAYEMNGAPLKVENGAPLRLASATKYGIKQIKRIGRIEFTNERPRDYWAESGYDWYAGF